MFSFQIILQQIKAKNEPKKIGAGYCIPSESDRLQYRFRFSFRLRPAFSSNCHTNQMQNTLKFDPETFGKTGFESGKYWQASGKTTRFRGKLLLCRFFGSGISNIFARNAWQDLGASTPCILLIGRI